MSKKTRFDGIQVPNFDATLRQQDAVSTGLPGALQTSTAVSATHAAQRAVSELKRYQAMERAGLVVLDLPLAVVHPSRFSNRSTHYFSSERYAQIRESLRVHGQQIPIKVRPLHDAAGSFEIIYGHTRHYALRELGASTIRAVIETLSDQDTLVQMELENRDRQDWSAYERARFYTDCLAGAFGGDREALCRRFGRSASWLSQQLTVAALPEALLDRWPRLYEGGINTLLALARAEPTAAELSKLIDAMADDGIDLDPRGLVTQLLRELKRLRETEPRRHAQVAAEPVQTKDGTLLLHATRNSRGTQLQFERAHRDFADFLLRNIDRFYQAYASEAFDNKR